jgi:hypothetical protein
MDDYTTAEPHELDLEAYVEDLDDTAAGALSTAASASSAGTFVGGCFSSVACFSTAS